MSNKRREIKVGDLVRVCGSSFTLPHKSGSIRHHLKPGTVCEVVLLFDGDKVDIRGPYRHDPRYNESKANFLNTTAHGTQTMYLHQVLHAPQAMKARDAYGNRRG